jgi:5-methylcytosine-specific restriction endonuclease McrA
MKQKRSASPRRPGGQVDERKLSDLVAESRQAQHEREKGYREQSLKIHPWICARCGREFTRTNLHLLTVHHKDHNHEHNPANGSNWENLCIYCHDNEHTRYLDHLAGGGIEAGEEPREKATYKPFAALKDLLKTKDRET